MSKKMTSEEFEDLAAEAKARLHDFLTKDFHNEDVIPSVRVAASVLSSWSRFHQTESAREATGFIMARELAQTPQEFKRYVAVACPNVPLVKMIEKKS